MGYKYFNPNPLQRVSSGDCTVRALSLAIGFDGDWYAAYLALCVRGYEYGEMPSANEIFASLLLDNGYKEYSLMSKCRDCYSIEQFCRDNPVGEYVACSGNHVVYCRDGDYYDSWDSGDVVAIYYFKKE